MAQNLGELWKKGTTPPLSSDIPEGGLAIDVLNKKAYSKDNAGSIFELGTTGAITEVEWGDITGDIPNQSDLQAELDLKADNADLITHTTDKNNPHDVTASQVGADPVGSSDSVRSELNIHIADLDNPHEVNKSDVGLGSVENIAPADMPITDDTQAALDLKANSADVFEIVDHIDVSSGTGDAAKPIILNSNGKVDVSMIDIKVFENQGNWTPDATTEYPPEPNDPGWFWVIEGVGDIGTGGYTFTGGWLTGSTIYDNELLVRSRDEEGTGNARWSILHMTLDPGVYYMLDGSTAITGAFAGGGQQFKNAAPGTEDTDLITLGQVAPLLDDYVEISGDTMSGNLEIHKDNASLVLTGTDSIVSGITDTGSALGIQTNRNDIVFSGVTGTDLQGNMYIVKDSGTLYRLVDESDIEIGVY